MRKWQAKSAEDVQGEQYFKENLHHLDNGAYCSRLIWRTPDGLNRVLDNGEEAKALFYSNEQRMLQLLIYMLTCIL